LSQLAGLPVCDVVVVGTVSTRVVVVVGVVVVAVGPTVAVTVLTAVDVFVTVTVVVPHAVRIPVASNAITTKQMSVFLGILPPKKIFTQNLIKLILVVLGYFITLFCKSQY
jgi:hypothetical protein